MLPAPRADLHSNTLAYESYAFGQANRLPGI